MLYIPMIDDCLKILTHDEVKDFAVKKFGEYFKTMKKRIYSKPVEEQNLTKVVKLLYICLMAPDEVEKSVEMMLSSSPDNRVYHYKVESLHLFDPELQVISTEL